MVNQLNHFSKQFSDYLKDFSLKETQKLSKFSRYEEHSELISSLLSSHKYSLKDDPVTTFPRCYVDRLDLPRNKQSGKVSATAGAPATIPLPRSLIDEEDIPIKDSNPEMDFIFGNSGTGESKFSPSFSELLKISSTVTQVLTLPDIDAEPCDNSIMNYYSTFLLWWRLANIKKSNGDTLTPDEELLLNLTVNDKFSVPLPLSDYLMAIGNVEYDGQSYSPQFPDLPQNGYFSPWKYPNHNEMYHLLVEYPTIGYMMHVIQRTLGSKEPEPAVFLGLPPEESYPGYSHSSSYSLAMRRLLANSDVTINSSGHCIGSTNINLLLVRNISKFILSQTVIKVRLMSNIDLCRGSIVQLLPVVSSLEDSKVHRTVFSVTHNENIISAALLYRFQHWKTTNMHKPQSYVRGNINITIPVYTNRRRFLTPIAKNICGIYSSEATKFNQYYMRAYRLIFVAES